MGRQHKQKIQLKVQCPCFGPPSLQQFAVPGIQAYRCAFSSFHRASVGLLWLHSYSDAWRARSIVHLLCCISVGQDLITRVTNFCPLSCFRVWKQPPDQFLPTPYNSCCEQPWGETIHDEVHYSLNAGSKADLG